MSSSPVVSLLTWLLLAGGLDFIESVPLDDLVEELPLYGRPPTPQFSGFLDASDGCNRDSNGDVCKLHYWLALAEEEEYNDETPFSSDRLESSTKPVLLWLNGGPGSSGLFGWFIELGPTIINGNGGLDYNPWSWTKAAHLLVIEAPVGVGYSYCSNQFEGNLCKNTDDFTASASRAALVDFFTNKFPELQDKDFFMSGESYAGIYIPTLAKEILDNAPEGSINLAGIATGDPCMDNDAQEDSMDALWYGFKYGLVDEATYDLLWNKCDLRFKTLMTKGGKHLVSAELNQLVKKKKTELIITHQSKLMQTDLEQFLREEEEENQVTEAATKARPHHNQGQRRQQQVKSLRGGNKNMDEHNITMAAIHGELHKYARQLLGETIQELSNMKTMQGDPPECKMAYRKFLLSTSNGLAQNWDELYIDDFSLFTPVANQYEEYMIEYMNRDDVKKALHVEEAPTDVWPQGSFGFDYKKEYDACNSWNYHGHKGVSMIDIHREISPKLKRTWIFNGDTDPCVSYEGTRTAVKRIGFEEVDGGSYRPWFYKQGGVPLEVLKTKAATFGPNFVVQDMGMQLGGEVVNYEHNLSFITVHGAGHMVPQHRPQAALHMINRFLNFEELSPLMPPNATLMEASESSFMEDILDRWTTSAKLN